MFRCISEVGWCPSKNPLSELDVKEFATIAIHSATSILQAFVTDKEIQSDLCGLPIYFNYMIAFTILFLCETITKYPAHMSINHAELIDRLDRLVKVLNNNSASMHLQHSLSGTTSSMRHLVDRLEAIRVEPTTNQTDRLTTANLLRPSHQRYT